MAEEKKTQAEGEKKPEGQQKTEAERKKYSEAELERLFIEAGKRGAILAVMHFDAYGKSKDVVKQSIVELVSRITKESGVIYCYGEVEDVRERQDEKGGNEYSTYTEVKVLFSSISRAVSLCLKFAPVAVEIQEPNELKLNANEIQNLMLDASAMSQQFTNFYMSKMLKGGELEEFQGNLRKRAEDGRKLMEKAQEEK